MGRNIKKIIGKEYYIAYRDYFLVLIRAEQMGNVLMISHKNNGKGKDTLHAIIMVENNGKEVIMGMFKTRARRTTGPKTC